MQAEIDELKVVLRKLVLRNPHLPNRRPPNQSLSLRRLRRRGLPLCL
jgi:hypothetical protein